MDEIQLRELMRLMERIYPTWQDVSITKVGHMMQRAENLLKMQMILQGGPSDIKKYRVTLQSYSTNTSFDVELDDKELDLLLGIQGLTRSAQIGLLVDEL